MFHGFLICNPVRTYAEWVRVCIHVVMASLNISSSSTSGGAVKRCCGLHESTPCNSFTCHLCCTFHILSRHFLNIISPRYWWTTSTPFSFDCSLQYLLFNTFRSPNNVPKIVQFSFHDSPSDGQVCSNLFQDPHICLFIFPWHLQQSPIAPHFKGINSLSVFLCHCPGRTSVSSNRERSCLKQKNLQTER